MAITDLTGTTWRFGEYITSQYTTSFSYNITLEYRVVCNTIATGELSTLSLYARSGNYYVLGKAISTTPYYDAYLYYRYKNTPRIISAYQTNFQYVEIKITGGTDVTNSSAISWLEANATKQPTVSFKHFFHNSPIGTGTIHFRPYTVAEPLLQLATPQNVSADGTTVSWDEVENATSYEVRADGVSIGTVSVQSSETWLLNETLNSTEISTQNISFQSGGESFAELQYLNDDSGGYSLFFGAKNVARTIIRTGVTTWYYSENRTITFETTPTGDLLAWLQANATKQ